MTQPQSVPTQHAPRPRQARRDNDPWRMGPVTAAIYASGAALLTVMVFRATRTPGWYAAAFATAAGAALVAAGAGHDRQPRPLSVRSLAYRFTAMFVAGQWVFWQIADTRHDGGRAVAAFAAQLVVLVTVATVGKIARSRIGGWRWPLAVCVGVFVAGEGMVGAFVGAGGGHASEWLTYVATHAAPLNSHNLKSFLWPDGLLSLAGLATVFAILGKRFATYERDQDEARRRKLFMTSSSDKKQELVRLLPEITRQSVKVVAIEPWKNGAGETAVVDHSTTNMGSWEDLNQFCDTIASRLTLDNGCGVEADMGKFRGQARLHISRRNVLHDDHPYPYKLHRRSIYDRQGVGVLRPGDAAGVNLREDSMAVIGQRRSGKTMFLRNLQASLAQCVDTLIWVIDFNNGGLVLPYLRAWAQGRANRPMIDWVAYDAPSAAHLAEAAVAIAKDRKVFYEYLKAEHNVNLLPVSPQLPQIMIVMDEGAEVMGVRAKRDAQEVAEMVEEAQRIAGDSGVNTVLSFLRATTHSVPTGVMANSAVRVGMRVTDRNELGYLYGEWRLNPQDISEQGNGFILPGHGQPVRAFRGYLLNPESMDQIAVATQQFRPYLDARSREIAGEAYRNRWVTARHLLADRQGNIHVDLDVDPDVGAPDRLYVATAHGGVDTVVVSRPATAASDREPVDNADETLAEAGDAMARLRALREQPQVDLGDDESVNQAARQIFGSYEWDLPSDGEPAGGVAVIEPPTPPVEPPTPSVEPQAGPDAEEPVDSERVLEALILAEGPLGPTKMHRLLKMGGEWGPPVDITPQWMHRLLDRATYLRPRKDRQPYDHKDREGSNAT